jgi:hypothetical protein
MSYSDDMKILVCGTRGKDYREKVFKALDKEYAFNKRFIWNGKPLSLTTEIIEGCCTNSADQYAEEWAIKNNVKLIHHPGTKGTYLKRNIEMANECDLLIAFWDGYSYGTAHTIATATKMGKRVIVMEI